MTDRPFYPSIGNDFEYSLALKGAAATDRLGQTLAQAALAMREAVEADPDLAPALNDFAGGMSDLLSDLLAALDARDAALKEYEALLDGPAWEPAPGQREPTVVPFDIRRR